MDSLVFEAKTHIYTLQPSGQVIPSVTQIIEARYFCDPWYAEKGKAIHRMVELYLNDDLLEDSISPQEGGFDLRPYLEAFKLFQAEAPHVRGVIDVKSGQMEKWHFLQVCAYRELWLNGVDEHGKPLRETRKGTEVRGYSPLWRYSGTVDIIDIPEREDYPEAHVLYLKDNGKYKIEPVRDVRIHTQKFLTLVSAAVIRLDYGI